FHPIYSPELGPTDGQMAELMRLAKGVRILTLNHPDSTPAQDEEFLKKLAREPGYPLTSRERRRLRCLPLVLKLHWREFSPREIACIVSDRMDASLSHTAVRDWIDEIEALQV